MILRINLVNARKNRELTQVQVADTIGVSEQYYQRLEAGTSNGSIDTWSKLKALFNTNIDDLLEQKAINK